MDPRRAAHPGSDSPTCRVGYVVHSYPSLSHAFVLREVLALRDLGDEVHTFSVHRPDPSDLRAEADRSEAARTESILPIGLSDLVGVHVRAFRRGPGAYLRTLAFALRQAPGGARSWLWQLFYFAEAIILWSRAERRGVRHLHAHLTNVAADTAWLAATFGTCVNPQQPWTWSMTVHGPTEFAAVQRFNLARKVASAHLVICVSDYCRSQVMTLVDVGAWPKLRVIHCGVDLGRYPFRVPRRLTDATLLRILSVGRLVPEKGQAVLLEAVAALNRERLRATVTVVGDGPLAGDLRRMGERLDPTGRWLTLTGPLGQDELPSAFASHDVFCLPSFAEGVPVVFMEAMATGLPVVATRITGVPELVEDGVSGILVPPGRADLLTQALDALAEEPGRIPALAAAARRKVEAEFDIRAAAVDLHRHFVALEHGAPAGPEGTVAYE
jgi:colanic acid/amylovoran biosynthesis glycosyltransferase